MGMLFERDPITRTKRVLHVQEGTAEWGMETRQDVTTLVEDNKGRFNQFDERTRWKGDVHRVASIPTILYEELRRKGITDDPKLFKAWLNDPTNAQWRTRPGRV